VRGVFRLFPCSLISPGKTALDRTMAFLGAEARTKGGYLAPCFVPTYFDPSGASTSSKPSFDSRELAPFMGLRSFSAHPGAILRKGGAFTSWARRTGCESPPVSYTRRLWLGPQIPLHRIHSSSKCGKPNLPLFRSSFTCCSSSRHCRRSGRANVALGSDQGRGFHPAAT
jgi:hypothetical protein